MSAQERPKVEVFGGYQYISFDNKQSIPFLNVGSRQSLNGFDADVAYKLASNETCPSWGWWIVNGATTLYENWPLDAKSDISKNHIMFGEIGAWMYKALGGNPNQRDWSVISPPRSTARCSRRCSPTSRG